MKTWPKLKSRHVALTQIDLDLNLNTNVLVFSIREIFIKN